MNPYLLTPFKRFLLRWAFRSIIKQGHLPHRHATEVYRLLREAWRDQFFEENDPTVNANLSSCFDRSM